MSERQYALWDPENFDKPLNMANIDSGTGVNFPFWDESTKMVYIVGKVQCDILLAEFMSELVKFEKHEELFYWPTHRR